jgi:hypothetical protein
MPKPGLMDRLAGNGAFRLDEHFDHVFARFRSGLLQRRAALRQQPSAESQQMDNACQRCDGADRKRREHLQRLQPCLQHQASDDQIGAGAYQRARPDSRSHPALGPPSARRWPSARPRHQGAPCRG